MNTSQLGKLRSKKLRWESNGNVITNSYTSFEHWNVKKNGKNINLNAGLEYMINSYPPDPEKEIQKFGDIRKYQSLED